MTSNYAGIHSTPVRRLSPAAAERLRRRRRYERIEAILEAVTTLAIGISFIVCAILFVGIA